MFIVHLRRKSIKLRRNSKRRRINIFKLSLSSLKLLRILNLKEKIPFLIWLKTLQLIIR